MATIKNLDRLIRNLDDISKIELEKTMGKAVKKVQGQAKLLAPIDTGALRGSINTEVSSNKNEIVGKVYTNLEYAPYVEFGTGQRGASSDIKRPSGVTYKADWAGQEAQPFLFPSLEQNKEHIRNLFTNGLKLHLKNHLG